MTCNEYLLTNVTSTGSVECWCAKRCAPLTIERRNSSSRTSTGHGLRSRGLLPQRRNERSGSPFVATRVPPRSGEKQSNNKRNQLLVHQRPRAALHIHHRISKHCLGETAFAKDSDNPVKEDKGGNQIGDAPIDKIGNYPPNADHGRWSPFVGGFTPVAFALPFQRTLDLIDFVYNFRSGAGAPPAIRKDPGRREQESRRGYARNQHQPGPQLGNVEDIMLQMRLRNPQTDSYSR